MTNTGNVTAKWPEPELRIIASKASVSKCFGARIVCAINNRPNVWIGCGRADSWLHNGHTAWDTVKQCS